MKNMILERAGELVHHMHDGVLMCTNKKPAEDSIRTRRPADCDKCIEAAKIFRNTEYKGGYHK